MPSAGSEIGEKLQIFYYETKSKERFFKALLVTRGNEILSVFEFCEIF